MTERSSAESNEPSILNLEGEEFSLSFDTPELNLSFDIEELKGQRERRNVDENVKKEKIISEADLEALKSRIEERIERGEGYTKEQQGRQESKNTKVMEVSENGPNCTRPLPLLP